MLSLYQLSRDKSSFMSMNILIIFGYFITTHVTLVSGEYNVKDVVPSHLHHKFDNVKENIFPEDIRIKISLSRIGGTLLYTIDKNMNQMIVSLHDGLSITLGIQFRKKEIFLTLRDLCECQRCRFETLDLLIEIKDELRIQCNTGSMKSYPYDHAIAINEAYNIPKFNAATNISSKNEGHIWMVNTPYDKGIYPNGNQLLGCIIDVWYKTKPIKFEEISGNITDHCPRYCNDKVCNGGECYETYNGRPACNCTKAFQNGKYCNTTISQLNIKSLKDEFKFPMFKLSWTSSSNEILKIFNSNFQILLRTFGRILQFEYHYGSENHVNITNILSEKYKRHEKHIIIVIFQKRSIDIHYFNGSWFQKSMTSVSDLGKEQISTISLQSGDGQISLAYKNNPKYLEWKILKIINYEEIEIYKDQKENITNAITVIIPVILSIILLCGIAFVFFVYCKRQRNSTRKLQHNVEEDPGAQLLDIIPKQLEYSAKYQAQLLSTELSRIREAMEEDVKDTGKEFWMQKMESMKELLEKVVKDTGQELSERQMMEMKDLMKDVVKDSEKEFSDRQIRKIEDVMKNSKNDSDFSQNQLRKMKDIMEKVAKDTGKELTEKQMGLMKELLENVVKDTGQEFSERQMTKMKDLMEDIVKDSGKELSIKQMKSMKDLMEEQQESMKGLLRNVTNDTGQQCSLKLVDSMTDVLQNTIKALVTCASSSHRQMPSCSEKEKIIEQAGGESIKKTNKNVDKLNETMEEMNISIHMEDKMTEILLKVDQFSERKSTNKEIISKSFYSHTKGYKLRLQVYPGGDHDGKGTHLSVYFVICKGDFDHLLQWPCKHSIKISLMNQFSDREHYSMMWNYSTVEEKIKYRFHQPINDDNLSYGSSTFFPLEDIKSMESLSPKDVVIIKCTVEGPH